MLMTAPLYFVDPVARTSAAASSESRAASKAAHSAASMKRPRLPFPFSSTTLTAVRFARFATPNRRDATIPATWVPWPLPSVLLPSPA